VALVPTPRDVARYAESGPAPLAGRLEALAAGGDLRVVDLLPVFAAARRPQQLFHACDYHWSGPGHELAARHLVEALGPRFWSPESPTR
jgi:hypothetical protein